MHPNHFAGLDIQRQPNPLFVSFIADKRPLKDELRVAYFIPLKGQSPFFLEDTLTCRGIDSSLRLTSSCNPVSETSQTLLSNPRQRHLFEQEFIDQVFGRLRNEFLLGGLHELATTGFALVILSPIGDETVFDDVFRFAAGATWH
jgi:hypothetical protein